MFYFLFQSIIFMFNIQRMDSIGFDCWIIIEEWDDACMLPHNDWREIHYIGTPKALGISIPLQALGLALAQKTLGLL